ncbi:hypothetical protein [Acidocella sp. KAb 2-4]|uniref:hypothetical protein n=1 Tax=Acidocella sp. KAb 2-4 TaxID=2885158 RepID=UPI001D083CFC|nr:hypothetical protein [Acidocella sp. KAb 2-4]MCB5943441.1 hypothetical protein [Acidocella sp. KAb 2-4]
MAAAADAAATAEAALRGHFAEFGVSIAKGPAKTYTPPQNRLGTRPIQVPTAKMIKKSSCKTGASTHAPFHCDMDSVVWPAVPMRLFDKQQLKLIFQADEIFLASMCRSTANLG